MPLDLAPTAQDLDLATIAKERGIRYFMISFTDLFGFQRAIEVAVIEARNGVPEKIAERLGTPS